MHCWRKYTEVRGDFVEKSLCSFENNRCRHVSFFISLKYLFPFIFYLSGGKTYQPTHIYYFLKDAYWNYWLFYIEKYTCLFIHSFHCHVQNVVIPCCYQELLPFFPIIYFFLPLFSANYASILPHFVLPSIFWSTSWSCCFQIHTQYSFGNSIFFHSLYVSKPT